jgi:hypothetical protein
MPSEAMKRTERFMQEAFAAAVKELFGIEAKPEDVVVYMKKKKLYPTNCYWPKGPWYKPSRIKGKVYHPFLTSQATVFITRVREGFTFRFPDRAYHYSAPSRLRK